MSIGPIPSEIGELVNVTSLKLYNNSLTGMIPSELGLLETVNTLSLDDNSLSETIPSGLCNLSTWTAGLIVDCDRVECACSVCLCDR